MTAELRQAKAPASLRASTRTAQDASRTLSRATGDATLPKDVETAVGRVTGALDELAAAGSDPYAREDALIALRRAGTSVRAADPGCEVPIDRAVDVLRAPHYRDALRAARKAAVIDQRTFDRLVRINGLAATDQLSRRIGDGIDQLQTFRPPRAVARRHQAYRRALVAMSKPARAAYAAVQADRPIDPALARLRAASTRAQAAYRRLASAAGQG